MKDFWGDIPVLLPPPKIVVLSLLGSLSLCKSMWHLLKVHER